MGDYPLIMLRSRTVAIKGLHCQDQSFLRSLSWSEAALGMELLVTALFLEQFQHKEPQTPTTAKKTSLWAGDLHRLPSKDNGHLLRG